MSLLERIKRLEDRLDKIERTIATSPNLVVNLDDRIKRLEDLIGKDTDELDRKEEAEYEESNDQKEEDKSWCIAMTGKRIKKPLFLQWDDKGKINHWTESSDHPTEFETREDAEVVMKWLKSDATIDYYAARGYDKPFIMEV